MLDCLLDHKAQEHFFEVIDAPTLQLSRELLMRNIEKICQWLGMVKPEQMRKGSRHEDLKGDTVALAKLVMKEGEKPGKFLLPHGIILLGWWLRIFMEDNPYGIQNQSSFRIMELSGIARDWLPVPSGCTAVKRHNQPNNALQLTAYSLRYAPASGSS